jgi:hypothetical protein
LTPPGDNTVLWNESPPQPKSLHHLSWAVSLFPTHTRETEAAQKKINTKRPKLNINLLPEVVLLQLLSL